MKARTLRNSLVAAVALALCVAAPAGADEPASSFVDMLEAVSLVPAGTRDSEMLAKVTVAIGHIKRMDLARAQQAVNEALQLDPRNAYLHFLNAFVYHLQARQGDTQKAELALQGYQQALRIDPSNWIAQEFLGLAYLELKRFEQARLAFAETLLLTPASARSIYGLMVTSYLTGDAATACAMADQFIKVSAAPHAGFLRSSIPVYAACGNFARANWVRAALVQRQGDGREIERIDRRLAQWRAFHDRPAHIAPARPEPGLKLGDGRGRMVLTQDIRDAAESYDQPDSISDDSDDTARLEANDNRPAEAGEHVDSGPRMVLVDVVLLSTQELIATTKGVNLLHALTLQLGSITGNQPAYSRVFTSNESNGGDPDTSTMITRAVTIPALSYSLNIANANNSLNEVLARPTLAAMEGLTSEFFSGTNLSAGVVSASQQGGTTIVPVEKSFGIKLSVTPTFLPQGRVQLKVEAQRTALNASAENRNVAYQIEIGETTANANVVMNLGETLVLSGLSEKSSARTRDGVPVLQDVPGVQYLFSRRSQSELQRSVLILVTPRAPVQVSDTGPADTDPMDVRMKRLQDRFGFSDSTPGNTEALLTQMSQDDFFREFRQGDVSMERWDHMRSTGDRLKEALDFLYY